MAINERLVHTASAAAASGGNQEEGLILHLDANDVDSYDGDGSVWYDITNHEYKPTTNVSEHFNTVTYTGNNSSNYITGVGFQPDLVWVKRRTTSTANHYIVDTVRGNGTSTYKNLSSNTTDAEGTTTASGITNSTIVDGGFTMQGTGARTNASGSTYVAWCFKAGGAPTATNSGGQTPTSGSKMVDDVAVTDNYPSSDIYPNKQTINTKLGFSITNYTGNLSSTQTLANSQSIPHGLEQTPEMIIFKRTEGGSWNVRHKDIGNEHQVMFLNTTDGVTNYQSSYPIYPNDSNHFYTNWTTPSNISGSSHIAYSFISKRGVSKVGSYTGGSTGEIYTGFEPAFIMVKRTNASGDDWHILDNTRGGGSKTDDILKANTSDAEASASNREVTFTRNGFKWTNTTSNAVNTSGNNYIYLAIAKNTNETSLIPDTDLELHLDAASYSGSGTTWTADTGSDATISGASYDEELGDWFDFDGSNDYVQISPIPSTLQADYVITGEAWINPKSATNNSIISFRGSDNNSIKFFLSANSSGQVYLVSSSTSTFLSFGTTSSNSVPVGQWTHVAATINYNTKTYAIYINGDLASSGSQSSIRSRNTFGSTFFLIGANKIGTQHSNLKIGQVRVYSSALSQNQIRQNFNFTKNDYPNGYNGTISGATWNSGGYFDFDGSNDYIDLGDIRGTGNELTVSAWINPDSTQSNAYATVFDFEHSNDEGWVLYQDNTNTNNYKVALKEGSVWDSTSNISLSSGNWHHIAFTIDSNNDFELYVNNTNIQSLQNWSGLGTAERRLNLGCWGGTNGTTRSRFWNGQMTEIKVYDKALTQAEITALFNEGE